jgi:serine acetyltransferase
MLRPRALAVLRLRTRLVLGRQSHRQVGRRFSLENTTNIVAGAAVVVADACAIAHQPTGGDVFPKSVDCWDRRIDC